ncbi:MAG: hypothetical protein ABSA52_23805 [Candidatus Binatia bacterium]|jgi:hypothetical protein
METKPTEMDVPGADRDNEGQGILEEKLRMLHHVLSLLQQVSRRPEKTEAVRSEESSSASN